ncbi:MAG: inner membrane CreD family protein [Verrucomicrobia bacterium]|nr:inner membrane CreD family protein [Verrucomicrobiota bacterium]
MKFLHLLATAGIVACSAIAWFLLAAAIEFRTNQSGRTMREEVAGVWGPPLVQSHPKAWFDTPNAPNGRAEVLPTRSDVTVTLNHEPKRRGLVWHRTYQVEFAATHVFTNPTRIPQTMYINYPLPDLPGGLEGFECRLGDESETESKSATPGEAGVIRAVTLPAQGTITLRVRYETLGSDSWRYHFPDNRRVTGFKLAMRTNFRDINFPVGTASPRTENRQLENEPYSLAWDYQDILSAPDIGMDMPKQLNAGPVAARIAFFAPVSLLLFVTVLVLIACVRTIPLHPMHIFFVAAGFFAFHLLFAYLVDLIAIQVAFAIATAVSVLLVAGYLFAVGGSRLFAIALPAQLLYLAAFSGSFFFDGLTGITLTVLSIITLALLMFLTARTDWRQAFSGKPKAVCSDSGF